VSEQALDERRTALGHDEQTACAALGRHPAKVIEDFEGLPEERTAEAAGEGRVWPVDRATQNLAGLLTRSVQLPSIGP
jgi:hypothetical protein